MSACTPDNYSSIKTESGAWNLVWSDEFDYRGLPDTEKWNYDAGELDIMEHVGHDVGTIHVSAHLKTYQWQAGTQKTATMMIPDATTSYHTYALEWETDEIRGYVDDTLYFTYTNEGKGWDAWPYERDYYLLLNVAVGGAWGAVQGIDDEAFPQRMEVDYVRVYQR